MWIKAVVAQNMKAAGRWQWKQEGLLEEGGSV